MNCSIRIAAIQREEFEITPAVNDHGVTGVHEETTSNSVDDHHTVEHRQGGAQRNADERDAHREHAADEHELVVDVDQNEAAGG